MSVEAKKQLGILKARASILILAFCAGLYLYQFWFVWKYAVNLPFWDDWETFAPEQLPAGLSLHWLFAQHNEHRLATTKFLIWVLYKLDGWNVATHQILNFAIYGAILAWLIWSARKLAPETPAWVYQCFIIFLLSTIAIENHMMAYQSQVHFWLLFLLISAHFLFSSAQRTSRLFIGCMAAALSIFSLAAGVVSSLVLLISFAVFKSLHAHSAADRAGRKKELLQLLLVSALIGGLIALWTVGYQRPQHHTMSSILSPEFWNYYLNILSFNFGIDKVSATAGVVCLLIVLVPVCIQIFREGRNLPSAQWAVFSTTASILAVLASVAAGRAAFPVLQSKSSRYAEFGMALIPLSALAWGFLLQHRKRLMATFLAGLWIFLFASFLDNWRFQDYMYYHGQRMVGVSCIQRYYLRGGDALCPRIYPAPLATRLDAAKNLNASFYRDLDTLDQGEKK